MSAQNKCRQPDQLNRALLSECAGRLGFKQCSYSMETGAGALLLDAAHIHLPPRKGDEKSSCILSDAAPYPARRDASCLGNKSMRQGESFRRPAMANNAVRVEAAPAAKPSARFLTRTEAAEYLGETWGIRRSPKTLQKLASVGGGPVFRKIGRHPVYAPPRLGPMGQEPH
jgi:hypothetical protein